MPRVPRPPKPKKDPKPPKEKAPKGVSIKWNDPLPQVMLEGLSYEQDIGRQADGGFKPEAWTAVLAKVRVHMRDPVEWLDVDKMKSKFQNIKTKWGIWHALCENSGFGWDDEAGMPTAPDEVWDRYMASHPEAMQFRWQPLDHASICDKLFLFVTPTGQYVPVTGTVDNHDHFGEGFPLDPQLEPPQVQDTSETQHNSSINTEEQSPFAPLTSAQPGEPTATSQVSSRAATPQGHRIRSRQTGGGLISQQLGEFVEEMRAARIQRSLDLKTPFERALAQLQQQKPDMDVYDTKVAVQILSQGQNALTYMTLQGDLRDSWYEDEVDRAENREQSR